MPTPPLNRTQISEKLRSQDLDELLQLWWAEQGAEKRRDLELMAAALPFSPDENLLALDLCCGPGDVGRAIRSRFPNSRIDCVDRDLFLLSICIGVNQRESVPGQASVRDLWNLDWRSGLSRGYDVVATANALHWFDVGRAAELFIEIFQLLRPGGVFLFVEPACAQQTFATGFGQWKSKQPCRYDQRNWERFWDRANSLLGYDHTKLLGPRNPNAIGDGIPVLEWIQMLKNAGFDSIDVLLRDADEVMLASSKP